MSARFADITGRYVYLDINGIEYRVYFEEAGEGVPVVLQHTAGCDGRQWRHVLEDPDFTSRYRVIAVDLPFHGRSLPPVTEEWWTEEYKLRQNFLLDFYEAFVNTLELNNPVYAGVSLGGHLAPDLALHRPGLFQAAFGFGAALATKGVDRFPQWFHHPRVSNDSKPAMMYTGCAPQSPEVFKRETAYMYSQGAPPVLKGDVHYYFSEHDLTESAKMIDTTMTALHIVGSEYDWPSPPAGGEALASEVEGATFTYMAGVGHFSMSENPEVFKKHFLPLLDDTVQR